MGVVYAVYDRERDMRVALKQLRRVDPAQIYRFKREFRALRDLSHPNIVQLYDLVSHGADWFLTMELVHGVDLMSHVRGRDDDARTSSLALGSTLVDTERPAPERTPRTLLGHTRTWEADSGSPPAESPPATATRGPAGDMRPQLAAEALPRLRSSLRQLSDALNFLHSSGVVHRDLKPSNVLVERDERVVLMDFGMIVELHERRVHESGQVLGTPVYMAPEQALGLPITEAADWYAFGVILYEALCGTTPQTGEPAEILLEKATFEPVAPSLLGTDVPDDLDRLCMGLLGTQPTQRPTGAEVARCLGGRSTDSGSAAGGLLFVDRFVGRMREQERLCEGYARAVSGPARAALVYGPSGIGKTQLVDQFIAEVTRPGSNPGAHRSPLVLTGRCHESETLPYQAFDSVIDTVYLHLLDLPASRRKELLPTDMPALARIFPVLGNLPEVDRAPVDGDPADLRMRALDGLRDLIHGLARWRPIILRIEDAQWSDADSRDAFATILEPPPQSVFAVVTIRTEPEYARVVAARWAEIGSHIACDVIEVGPLSRI